MELYKALKEKVKARSLKNANKKQVEEIFTPTIKNLFVLKDQGGYNEKKSLWYQFLFILQDLSKLTRAIIFATCL